MAVAGRRLELWPRESKGSIRSASAREYQASEQAQVSLIYVSIEIEVVGKVSLLLSWSVEGENSDLVRVGRPERPKGTVQQSRRHESAKDCSLSAAE